MRQTILAFLAIGAFLSGVTFATTEEALAREGRKMGFEHAARPKELDIEAHEARTAHIQRPRRGPYHHGHKHGGFACMIGLIMITIRVLATIWVCGDLQRRKTASGLWIPIVILGGLLGLLVYAVIRLGDMPQTQTETV